MTVRVAHLLGVWDSGVARVTSSVERKEVCGAVAVGRVQLRGFSKTRSIIALAVQRGMKRAMLEVGMGCQDPGGAWGSHGSRRCGSWSPYESGTCLPLCCELSCV